MKNAYKNAYFINEHTETLYNMYQIYSTKFSEMFMFPLWEQALAASIWET